MQFFDIALHDWATLCAIIGQAAILFYRMKKVEQRTDCFSDLMIEFAVQKKSLELHREEVEKQSSRTEIILQRLDSRLSLIESHALKNLIQNNKPY